MAKPNYSFQKRQRELAKKQKKEQKMQQKLAGKAKPDEGLTPTPGEDEARTADDLPSRCPAEVVQLQTSGRNELDERATRLIQAAPAPKR